MDAQRQQNEASLYIPGIVTEAGKKKTEPLAGLNFITIKGIFYLLLKYMISRYCEGVTMFEACLEWILANIVLTLFLPLFINHLFSKTFSVFRTVSELFENGQLFFFSSSLSAAAISSLVFQKISNSYISYFLICSLLIIMSLSNVGFALASTNRGNGNRIFIRKFCITCVLLAIILNIIVFILIYSSENSK
jgi:hypothetical protein